MKIFHKAKDGGPDSNVTGYWLIEWKSVFSIAILCFDKGSREAFHNHAFNAVSWVLKGMLNEYTYVTPTRQILMGYVASLIPIYTPKNRMHQVHGVADKTWVITFRGPWDKTWKEYLPKEGKEVTLTNGRRVVE
jgi:quercetin dioxygenase-like cupin family protein